MAPRKAFEDKLEELRMDILQMGSKIEVMFSKTLEAVINQDEVLAKEVMLADEEIDELEVAIEHKCITLINHQQPTARDLRLIISILKIATDMERIADHCEDICAYSRKIHDVEWRQEAYQRHIEKMANNVQIMFKTTLDSFMQKDVEKIKEICHYDDKIDEAFDRNWKEIIEQMQDREDFIKTGARYIMIIKYLERIADHTTNIAESLVYHLTGEYAISYKNK